tara:strand:- start:64 stop:663 length:600 start_codon:yes stop_codon:yes gene_type:complete
MSSLTDRENQRKKQMKKYYDSHRSQILKQKRKHYQDNIEEYKKRRKENYQKNREKILEEKKKEYKDHKSRYHNYSKKYYQENRAYYLQKARKDREENGEHINKLRRERQSKIKEEVYRHYGNGKIMCVCCGESNIKFLTLDHIHNNGKQHRSGKSFRLAVWAKKNNYPSTLQVMCMNCNWARSKESDKICPHKKFKSTE